MDIEGKDVWEFVRPVIIQVGPKKVLRRIAATGVADISEPIEALIERMGPAPALRTVGVKVPSGGDSNAVDEFLNKTQDLKRVSNDVALLLFDAWAEDEEFTGRVAAHVVRAFGRIVNAAEFDAGVPGSAQSVGVWRLRKQYFIVGELGSHCGL
jgi:hypothetical protein